MVWKAIRMAWQWLKDFLKESTERPPYPFDDDEGAELWRAGKQEHDAQAAHDKQVEAWYKGVKPRD